MPERVSIIVPCHNAGRFLEPLLRSWDLVEFDGELEMCIHDDASTDDSGEIINKLEWSRGPLVISRSGPSGSRRGAGFARNAAIGHSSGSFLCFNDADDLSLAKRLVHQVAAWKADETRPTLVGARFVRDPPDATRHYASQLNSLDNDQLYVKQYREIPVILSTWFTSRKLFDAVGPFSEGLAEDLEWFHRLMDLTNVRVCVAAPDEPLVVYRHTSGSLSSQTPRKVLVEIRTRAFERRVLSQEPWSSSGFYVWGAGRDGRAFFSALAPDYRSKVLGFFDVDEGKIKAGFHHELIHPRVLPIFNATDASELSGKTPFVVCVALGRTGGALEHNIARLGLREGQAYWHFN